jgi:hypothetical protein
LRLGLSAPEKNYSEISFFSFREQQSDGCFAAAWKVIA